MSEFKIYSSSAGSGKTYTLTRTYLELVLSSEDPFYYQHILAVTFTNDAAAEMKQRILSALNELGKPQEKQNSSVTSLKEDILTHIPGLTEEQLQRRASGIFRRLLEDYGNFHIKTIDSFVNQLVSTFSRDLNLPYNYEIVLDKKPILTQAVDRVFERIGRPEYQFLSELIVEYALENADEGKNWRSIRQQLSDFAENLFNDQFYHLIQKNSSLKPEDFRQIKKQLDKKISIIRTGYLNFGKRGQEILQKYSLSIDEFSYGKNGFAGLFLKTLDPDNELLNKDAEPGKRVIDAITTGIFYAKNATSEVKQKLDAAAEILTEWFNQLDNFLITEKPVFLLLKEIRRNLDNLALLEEINKEFLKILQENNQAYITDFNRRINALIASEPVPYIFERLGEKFNHILIDEFQDTSDIQFYNMLPLIENSLAKNKFNMLVGDPKQSIYRWRGGKVDLMLQLMGKEVTALHNNPLLSDFQRETVTNAVRSVTKSTLQNNYRSTEKIIEFNNTFFSHLSEKLNEPKIKLALEDVIQFTHPKTIRGGHISLSFYQKEENEELSVASWMIEQTEKHIQEGLKAGFSAGDIAILCREKKYAAQIARHLVSLGFDVSSADSLLIRNNPIVRFIVSLFKVYTDPAYSASALLNFQQFINEPFPAKLDYRKVNLWEYIRSKSYPIDPDRLGSLGLYQMTESLIQTFGIFNDGPHLPYLFAFLDLVQDYAKNRGNDLRGFLKHWSQIERKAAVEIKNPNAITVCTIHKSKGLEFPLVILPFASWSLRPKNSSHAWIDLEHLTFPELEAPTARLQAAPMIITNKGLAHTAVADQQQKEIELNKLEEINSLYVALTRPIERLYILSSEPTQNKEESIYGLLKNFAEVGMEEIDNGTFIFSQADRKLKAYAHNQETSRFELTQLTSKENLGNIRIQSNLDLLFNKNNQRDRGILIHTLFSEIRVASDLKRALAKLKTEGLISETEQDELEKDALEILEIPQLKYLFSGNIRVENERDILQKNTPASRPDRVVHHERGITIIDYKTGIPSESHARQLQHYGQLYRQMGFNTIELLLIYFNPTKLVPVNF
jgi:ATP-dependent helicase/nuclease subunit A